ncbi:hypothetical protein [Marinimicrobium sp. ABcell2]|uniref:hypothetical protein n=1 Tax=Marinimicrobium sp. ABcell2 TaxID=3069751 RepID=UPI0027B48893|nr:hypothetical protein [Marinimicrobium sp. ABcell2]MDQ2077533.1 hypothetical protein [Marinimicrobium sp. ABcell2]
MSIIENPVSEEKYRTDILTGRQQIQLVLAMPNVKGSIYLFVAVTGIIFPKALFGLIFLLIWMWLARDKSTFPGRVPAESGKLDKSDLGPGGKGFRKGRGQVYFGWHRGTGKEAWGSFDDLLTHLYMLAATGGGKTEAIWAILCNFLCAGSGWSFIDGKGTLALVQNGRILARRFGMEDQLFIINYVSPSAEHAQKRMTNTLNPYTHGTAAQLKEQLASLSLSGDAGQNQFFEDNASVIIESVFPALTELRDKGIISLDIQTIGAYLPIDRIYKLTVHPQVSPKNQTYIRHYLETLGFDFEAAKQGKKQNSEVIKMYGQFVTHFSKAISSLSIQYGNIYVVDQGDINMKDILGNRRLLIGTLPSLEKSGGELKNLGNIVMTTQKNAISTDLGDILEGTKEETLLRLSSSWSVPYALTYDEWAFYAIKDIALIPAQVRGIKYCGIFAAQDYAGTEGAGEKDAEQVFANTRYKFFGALEEAGKSWTRIRDLMGEFLVAVNSNYKYIPGLFGGRQIIDREKTEITRRAPVEIKDLQQQVEGQFMMFTRGRLSPIQFFHTNIEGMEQSAAPGHTFKINRLCRVYPPTDLEMERIEQEERYQEIMYSPGTLFSPIGMIKPLKQALSARRAEGPLEARDYIAVLNEYIERNALKLGVKLNQRLTRPKPKTDTETPTDTEATAPHTESTAPPSAGPETEPNLGSLAAFDPGDLPPSDSPTTSAAPQQTEPESAPETAVNTRSPESEAAQAEPTPAQTPMAAPAQAPVAPQATKNAPENGELDLHAATLAAKKAIIDAPDAPGGAHILSKEEAANVRNDMTQIAALMGYSAPLCEKTAQQTLDNLERHCYYLAPPKPRSLDMDKIKSLEARVNALLEGV